MFGLLVLGVRGWCCLIVLLYYLILFAFKLVGYCLIVVQYVVCV